MQNWVGEEYNQNTYYGDGKMTRCELEGQMRYRRVLTIPWTALRARLE